MTSTSHHDLPVSIERKVAERYQQQTSAVLTGSSPMLG
jgi:hypothetical protein